MASPRLFAGFALLQTLAAFNIDQNHPIVFHPRHGDDDGLFGYSIALNRSTLYVGAPGQARSGAVFQCDFDGNDVRDTTVRVACDIIRDSEAAKSSCGFFMSAKLAFYFCRAEKHQQGFLGRLYDDLGQHPGHLRSARRVRKRLLVTGLRE